LKACKRETNNDGRDEKSQNKVGEFASEFIDHFASLLVWQFVVTLQK
tara:strand:- start:736 stop:876 length:141 start_codon:yes stop_codon:yes gene_type:complete